MKTLVLGIGNNIKKDDAVGLEILDLISSQKIDKEYNIDFKTSISGRIFLINEIEGYDNVYLIDSIKTDQGNIGDWYSLDPEDVEEESGFFASHNINLGMMKDIGESMGHNMPEIKIIAIEVKNPFEFGEELTEEVQEVIKPLSNEIKEYIEEDITRNS